MVLTQVEDEPSRVEVALRELIATREAVAAALAVAVEQAKAARLDLLRARADVAESRVRQAEEGGSERPTPIRRFRDELASLVLEVRVLQAQLSALPDAPAINADQAPAEDPQRVRSELLRVENELRTTESGLQQAQRDPELLGAPPTLVVLDGREEK